MNKNIHAKFREAVKKQIELWDVIRDLEYLILDEETKPGAMDGIDGLDEAVRDVACGHDCAESADAIAPEAIEGVVRGLLSDPDADDDEEGGNVQ